MSDYRYVLQDTFEYALNGNVENAKFIDLNAPNARFLSNLAPIRCEVMKAIQWSQEQTSVQTSSSEETKELKPSVMITTLELANNIDMVKVLLNVKEIITAKNMAKIDGESNFNKSLYDKMSLKDIYGITGQFIVDFTIPSLS